MRARQFGSFDEALAYLKSKGEAKYWGRIGDNHEINLYTLTTGGREYTLYVYQDGRVEVQK